MHKKKHTYRAPRASFITWIQDALSYLFPYVLIAAVAGGGGYWYHIHGKQRELAVGDSDLQEARSILESLQNRADVRRREVYDLQARVSHMDTLTDQKRFLTARIPEAERERVTLREDLTTLVYDARKKAVGTAHDELHLADGEVLSGVRILSVFDTEMSVAHDGGVLRIPARRLPGEFHDRFLFGMGQGPTTGDEPVPPSSVSLPAQPLPPANVTASAPRTASPARTMTEAQRKQRLDVLNATLLDLKNKMFALEREAANENSAAAAKKAARPRPQSSDPAEVYKQQMRDAERKAAEQKLVDGRQNYRATQVANLLNQIMETEVEITALHQAAIK